MKIHNKTAIITGASRGFGLILAEQFIKNGANILICARDKEALEKAKLNLTKHLSTNQRLLIKITDVSKKGQIKSLIDYASSEFGKFDILVNNAGIHGPYGTIDEVDLDEWQDALNMNIMSMVYTTHYATKYFKNQNYGKIINLAGGGSNAPLPTVSSYAAAKSAITRLTENFAVELKKFNIFINAINPGTLSTDMNHGLIEKGKEKIDCLVYERLVSSVKKGGDCATRAAELAIYLASSESDHITGKLFNAVWDNWREFDKNNIINSDIYNVRRVRADS